MPENIVVRIVGDATGLTNAVGDAEKGIKGMGGGISSLLSPAMLGVAGAATVAVAAIASMTMAAAQDRDEQAKLEQSIRAAGAAHGDWAAQVDNAISRGQELAFTDTAIRDALAPLVAVTGDVGEATGLLATAQDVARATGTDLTTAANAVAKAHEGNTGALKRLMPALGDVKDGSEAVAKAQKLAAGQSDLYAQSTEGQLEKSKIGFDELQETIGSAFLPILDEIVPALVPIVETLGELIKAVLPIAIRLIRQFSAVFRVVVDVLGKVFGIVNDVWQAIDKLLGPLRDAIKGLQDLTHIDLPHFDLPSFSLPFSAPAPAGTLSGGRRGSITINTGADPRSVVRHVRAYTRANGAIG